MKKILCVMFLICFVSLAGSNLYATTYSYVDQTNNLWMGYGTAASPLSDTPDTVEYKQNGALDVVGDRNIYDTKKVDLTIASSSLQFDIYTKYNGEDSLAGKQNALADFFLDFGSKGFFGVDLTVDNNEFSSTGVYKLTDRSQYETSEDVFYNDTWAFYGRWFGTEGNWENPNVNIIGGDSVGNASALTRTVDSDNFYIYSFVLDSSVLGTMGVDASDSFSFLFGTAECGNDVITGTSPVPEPATIILLGIGLLGISAVGRKNSIK